MVHASNTDTDTMFYVKIPFTYRIHRITFFGKKINKKTAYATTTKTNQFVIRNYSYLNMCLKKKVVKHMTNN